MILVGNILNTVVREVLWEDVARDLNEIWECSLQRSEEWVFRIEGTASAKTLRQE